MDEQHYHDICNADKRQNQLQDDWDMVCNHDVENQERCASIDDDYVTCDDEDNHSVDESVGNSSNSEGSFVFVGGRSTTPTEQKSKKVALSYMNELVRNVKDTEDVDITADYQCKKANTIAARLKSTFLLHRDAAFELKQVEQRHRFVLAQTERKSFRELSSRVRNLKLALEARENPCQ